MKKYLSKMKSVIVAHKILSFILLVAVLYAGYWGYKKSTSTAGVTRYVSSKVEKGEIVASVSGTGQVSASSQIDLKPKVSGDIIYLGAENGKKVASGSNIAQIDAKDAQKSVRDAEVSLASAKLSLEKLKIQNSDENLDSDLEKAYNDALSDVSSAFLDLPSIVNGLKSVLDEDNLSNNKISNTARSYREKAEVSYYAADKAFDKNQEDYALTSSDSSRSEIEGIIRETAGTSKNLSDAVKNTLDFVNYMSDHSDNTAQFAEALDTLSGYATTIATHLANLTSAETDIENNKDSSQNADIDIESAELSVTQKENALEDAKDKLADYFVRAPYAGTIANMTVKKADSVSSSTVIATLITDKQIAEISLNEVDVAKINIGQKAKLTFDAVSDLTIRGEVEEIDSIGAVSQGVVTYNVKITFDTEDARVKPGMSVSADIITDMKQDVLVVPNSAVKSQNGRSYVEMFATPLPVPTDGSIGSISATGPERIMVETGLANDSRTEIISGINEGDEIVVRTITGTSAAATTAAPSLFGGGGNRAGATGAVRVQQR